MAQTQRATDTVQAILEQGGDPKAYRQTMIAKYGVTEVDIDAIIAAAGQPRQMDAETVAQNRLSADRRAARTHRSAYRAYQHEED